MNSLLDLLFRRHNKELLAFAERQPIGHAAEDIVQEAFIRLMQHPDPTSIENPRAYLFKTTANLSANQYQYDQVRNRRHSEEPIDPETLTSPLPGPDALIDGNLRVEKFMAVLEQLPEVCQHAFILHRLEDLSYAEVGKSLGISAKTAQRYVLKVWQHCIHHLADELFDDDLST